MTIERFDGCTDEAYKKATRGYGMVFEEFGPPATGKTRRANALAEMLSMQGKRVLIADDLPGHDSYPGVRVFVKKK